MNEIDAGEFAYICFINFYTTVHFIFQRKWKIGVDKKYHFNIKNTQEVETTLPSADLAKQIIDYAREMEMII